MTAENRTSLVPGPGQHGRALALDLGDKRIGVALSDETRTIARSLTVLKRGSRIADFESIGRIVDEQGVTLLVVGLPVPLSGVEGDKIAWVRHYAADLASRLDLPLELWDESFSTVQAQASLQARGKTSKQQRVWIDAVAAAIILQDFLDARRGDVLSL